MNNNQPDTERELREAVRSDAESVQPADRLGAIRARTQGGSKASARSAWWRGPWVLAGGAALVAASVVAGAMALVEPDRASDSEIPAANGGQRQVTVYTIGQVSGRQWLYPEQVTTKDTGDAVLDAVRALQENELAGNNNEFVYAECGFEFYPQSVELGSRFVTIDYAGGAGGLGYCVSETDGSDVRRQQLAWTVRSAIGWEGPVRGTVDGQEVHPAVEADPTALSPIIVESPTDGATVSSPVRVSGTSDTFEANVVWEVVSEEAGVAKSGTTMGGTMGERAPFRFTVDLPPGDYTVRAYAESPEDGSLFAEDTTAFTVE